MHNVLTSSLHVLETLLPSSRAPPILTHLLAAYKSSSLLPFALHDLEMLITSPGDPPYLSNLIAVYKAYNPLPPALRALETHLPARLPPLPETFVPRVVSYTIVLYNVVSKRELGTDRERLTFLHLLPSPFSSHALTVVCGTSTYDGAISSAGDLSVFSIVINVLLGRDTTLPEIDHVVSMFPTSVFEYIEVGICEPTRRFHFTVVCVVGVVLVVVICLLVYVACHVCHRIFTTRAAHKKAVSNTTGTVTATITDVVATKGSGQDFDNASVLGDATSCTSVNTSSSSESAASSSSSSDMDITSMITNDTHPSTIATAYEFSCSDLLSLAPSSEPSIISAHTMITINAPQDILLAPVVPLSSSPKFQSDVEGVSAEKTAISIPSLDLAALSPNHFIPIHLNSISDNIALLSIVRVRVETNLNTSTLILVTPSTIYLDNFLSTYLYVHSPLSRRSLRIAALEMIEMNTAAFPQVSCGPERARTNALEDANVTSPLVEVLAMPIENAKKMITLPELLYDSELLPITASSASACSAAAFFGMDISLNPNPLPLKREPEAHSTICRVICVRININAYTPHLVTPSTTYLDNIMSAHLHLAVPSALPRRALRIMPVVPRLAVEHDATALMGPYFGPERAPRITLENTNIICLLTNALDVSNEHNTITLATTLYVPDTLHISESESPSVDTLSSEVDPVLPFAPELSNIGTSHPSKPHESSPPPPPLSEPTNLPLLSSQATSFTLTPLDIEEVVAPTHVHSCPLEILVPTLASENLHQPYVSPLPSPVLPSSSIIHTQPDEDFKPALGIITNNCPLHTSRNDPEHPTPSQPPPMIPDATIQAALPDSWSSADADKELYRLPPAESLPTSESPAAVHRQPISQHLPLSHQTLSQNHRTRYHVYGPYRCRPRSEKHQRRRNSNNVSSEDNTVTLATTSYLLDTPHISESPSVNTLSSEVDPVLPFVPELSNIGVNDTLKLHESSPPTLSEATDLPVLLSQGPSLTTAPLDVDEVVPSSHLPKLSYIGTNDMSKLHEPSLPPPLSEVTELPVLSLQAPSHTTAPLVVEEVVAPSHVHSCALEVSAPTLISETLHHPYVGPLFSTAPPSPSAVHTMPDEDSKPALGIIPNNYTPHTSRTDLQHSMPSKPPPAISDVMSQAAPPVGSFAAALAAVHRQPLPQHSPLPHRPRSQHHQNRYHEHKPYPVRPTSKAHQLRLSSQPTIPPASKSGSQRLTSTQHDGYPDWRAESEQDQLKPGSQGSFHDEEYPDWRAEAEKDRLKSQEAFCSNESPDWGAPSTKDGSKLSSTKDDGYPDWRAESQRDRSEPKFPDPSSSSNRWRGESTRDRFARGGKWETGHSAEDLGLHTPFSTSMRSERERIQNRDEYLRKVRRKM